MCLLDEGVFLVGKGLMKMTNSGDYNCYEGDELKKR